MKHKNGAYKYALWKPGVVFITAGATSAGLGQRVSSAGLGQSTKATMRLHDEGQCTLCRVTVGSAPENRSIIEGFDTLPSPTTCDGEDSYGAYQAGHAMGSSKLGRGQGVGAVTV